jgi:hypothetical protein
MNAQFSYTAVSNEEHDGGGIRYGIWADIWKKINISTSLDDFVHADDSFAPFEIQDMMLYAIRVTHMETVEHNGSISTN